MINPIKTTKHYYENLKIVDEIGIRFLNTYGVNIKVIKINDTQFPDAEIELPFLGKNDVEFKRVITSEKDETRQANTENIFYKFSKRVPNLPIGTYFIDLNDKILLADGKTKDEFVEYVVKYLEENKPPTLNARYKYPLIHPGLERLLFNPTSLNPRAPFFYIEWPIELASFTKRLKMTLGKVIEKYPNLVSKTVFILHSRDLTIANEIEVGKEQNQELLNHFRAIFYYEEEDDENKIYKIA